MKFVSFIKKIRYFLGWFKTSFPVKDEFGKCGKNTIIHYPVRIYSKQSVYIDDNVKLSAGLNILNSPREKVIIKKYSVLAANCTIAPNSHRSTVSIPQFLLGESHVHDHSTNVIIEEDVWLGTGVIVLSGVRIGRGTVVGAGSIVTKSFPPYSVIVGTPARIVKKKFSVEGILAHEKKLYPECDRIPEEQLLQNERQFFCGLPEYGTDEELTKEELYAVESAKIRLKYIC